MEKSELAFHGKAVTISCTDQRRSERFYEGVLGAERLAGDGYGCPWFRLGELTLSLMQNAAEPSPAEFPTHAMPILWLEVKNLAAAHGRLVRSGARIIHMTEALFLQVMDPDGLLIEVWQSEPDSGEGLA